MAQASFWLSLLLTIYFVLQGLVLWPLNHLALWHLVESEVQHQQLHSPVWLLAHPVAASMIVALLCLASTVSSWGLLRERRWALWSFVVLLLLSGLSNFAVARWLDVFMRDLIPLLADDPALLQELQLKRWLITLTVVGMSFVLLGLQGWLAGACCAPTCARASAEFCRVWARASGSTRRFAFDRQRVDMLSLAPYRHWLAWALLLATPVAAAQAPQCGLFKADEGSSTLRVSSSNRGEQKHFGSAPTPVAFQQIEGKLQLVSLEYGLPSALQVRDRGRTLEVDGTVYTLQAPAQCAAAAAPAAGSCLADAAACSTTATRRPRPCWQRRAGKACPACACSWPIAGMTRPGRRPRRMRRSNRPSSIPHWPASNCLCRAGMAASATRHRPVQRRWKRIRRCGSRSSRPRWVRRWSKP